MLDNGAPRGIASALRGHSVKESRTLGWDELKNGELLEAAETAGFEVFVTTDKNIRHQQNLSKRKIAIVILGIGRWHIIRPNVRLVVAAVNSAKPGSVIEVAFPER